MTQTTTVHEPSESEAEQKPRTGFYLARIHRELAEQLDRRAEECAAAAEEFDELAERASQIIRKRGS